MHRLLGVRLTVIEADYVSRGVRKILPHQREELAEWVADFARKADAAKAGLKALYLEMNGFTIDPDEWHCNLFGHMFR